MGLHQSQWVWFQLRWALQLNDPEMVTVCVCVCVCVGVWVCVSVN